MPRESISPSWEEFCKYKGIKTEYPLTKADFYFDDKDEYIYLKQAGSDGAKINFNPDKYDTSLLARALYEPTEKL